MSLFIESNQNERFKSLVKLVENNRFRKKSGLIFTEGEKEVMMAIDAGFQLKELYFNHRIPENLFQLSQKVSSTFILHERLFAKVAYRETTSQLIGVFKMPLKKISDLKTVPNQLVLILEGVEKPGNIGAIIRSADAAGISAVLIDNPSADIWHPNVIRSSVGTVFTLPVIATEKSIILEWCHQHQIQILAAALQDAKSYTEVNFVPSTAIVLGAEDSGLEEFWRQHSDHAICIPMLGANDSLNVSVTAGILIFEAIRQRQAGFS